MAKIAYWYNLNLRNKYFGYKPEDELIYVGEVEVESRPHSNGLDAAYRRFNRISEEEPTPELDEAEAPSMSVGDVAQILGGTDQETGVLRETNEWFAVANAGFELIKEPSELLRLRPRPGTTVRGVISATVDKINREGR